MIVASPDADAACDEIAFSLGLVLGKFLVERPVDQGSSLTTNILCPRHRPPGSENCVLCHARHHVACSRDIDQHRLGVVEPGQGLGIGDGASFCWRHSHLLPSLPSPSSNLTTNADTSRAPTRRRSGSNRATRRACSPYSW